ncbi:MAG TPA: PEFG-CTERM sorting domain-containing protein [Nitrososphaera sp.]|nr:PEFG-CTERM sorting domain-containing protein [Nitrososphaera sp.]
MFDLAIMIIVSLSAATSFGPDPVDEVYSYDHACANKCKYLLEVANKTFSIDYSLIGQFGQKPEGLRLDRIDIDTEKKSIAINLITDQYGRLELILPKELIQSLSYDRGINATIEVPFTVLIDGVDVTHQDAADGSPTVSETNTNNRDSPTRTIFIRFEKGTERIEIIGTQVVPEFGSIAVMLMAVGIVGIIVATRRPR